MTRLKKQQTISILRECPLNAYIPFEKSACWIDEGFLEFWSVYMSKHPLTRHKVAFEDAIDNMGHRFPSPWAAMWKVFEGVSWPR
mmetsp:Transcript_38181/g.91396  ORF Transcript_38181/g.91396 Transcript_38181/m.91396 type:complete len:85 (+) Transcript_38181:335-589(+)